MEASAKTRLIDEYKRRRKLHSTCQKSDQGIPSCNILVLDTKSLKAHTSNFHLSSTTFENRWIKREALPVRMLSIKQVLPPPPKPQKPISLALHVMYSTYVYTCYVLYVFTGITLINILQDWDRLSIFFQFLYGDSFSVFYLFAKSFFSKFHPSKGISEKIRT